MQVLVEGVTQTSQHGLPKEINQHEVKNRKDIVKIKGTVRGAVKESYAPLHCPLVSCGHA